MEFSVRIIRLTFTSRPFPPPPSAPSGILNWISRIVDHCSLWRQRVAFITKLNVLCLTLNKHPPMIGCLIKKQKRRTHVARVLCLFRKINKSIRFSQMLRWLSLTIFYKRVQLFQGWNSWMSRIGKFNRCCCYCCCCCSCCTRFN